MQILGVGLTKLSFVFFYRRIFVTGKPGRNVFSIISFTVIGIVLTWMIAFFFAIMLNCGKHVSANWTPALLRTECDDGLAGDLGLAISDFLTDLIVLVLPIPMVSHATILMVIHNPCKTY